VRESLHAEWTKLRTLASTFWLLLAAAALTVAVSAAAAAAVRCPSGGCTDDPAKISLTGIYLGQAVVAVLAVMAVSGEYGTGMIRVTLAATPRRLTETAPLTAGLAIQATTGLNTLPISPWAGLGVLAAWAAGALVLGGMLLRSRDA
jgi:ABC-2 type transport system permease protein